MTLQQLKYIVAIDRYRNFAKAADACGISQPTLSAMLVKLEEELDVRIFERSNKSVTPTIAGEKIIRQAERAIAEAERIAELVSEDKGDVAGEFNLSVGPTIAPYVLPKFIRHYIEAYPQVKLSIREMKADVMLSELQLGREVYGVSCRRLLAQTACVQTREFRARENVDHERSPMSARQCLQLLQGKDEGKPRL